LYHVSDGTAEKVYTKIANTYNKMARKRPPQAALCPFAEFFAPKEAFLQKSKKGVTNITFL